MTLSTSRCRPYARCDKGYVQRRLFIQGDEERLNALEQIVSTAAGGVGVLAAGG